MILNWNVSQEDHDLIVAIAKRAERLTNWPVRQDIIMDLTACHANGNPLDLAGLLKADDGNFLHDVMGIRRHLDRDTGKLLNCFVPRYSAIKETK